MYFQFFCDPHAMLDQIIQVEEPSSCEYVLKVSTNRLCSLAKFKPPPAAKPMEIRCHPILSPEEFEKYLEYEKGGGK